MTDLIRAQSLHEEADNLDLFSIIFILLIEPMWQAPIEEEGEQVAQRDQVVPSALLDFFVRIFRREQEISNEWNLTSV